MKHLMGAFKVGIKKELEGQTKAQKVGDSLNIGIIQQ
jgi:hypothetical protein